MLNNMAKSVYDKHGKKIGYIDIKEDYYYSGDYNEGHEVVLKNPPPSNLEKIVKSTIGATIGGVVGTLGTIALMVPYFFLETIYEEMSGSNVTDTITAAILLTGVAVGAGAGGYMGYIDSLYE